MSSPVPIIDRQETVSANPSKGGDAKPPVPRLGIAGLPVPAGAHAIAREFDRLAATHSDLEDRAAKALE